MMNEPFSLRHGQTGRLKFDFITSTGVPPVAVGGILVNGRNVPMVAGADSILYIPVLPPGVYLMEVRCNGVTVLYSELEVLASPLGMVDGAVEWAVDVDMTQPLPVQNVTLNDGPQGVQGEKGDTGASAYELAQKHGYEGTEAEWVAELQGAQEAANEAKAAEAAAANSAAAAADDATAASNSATAAAASATAAGNSATAAAASESAAAASKTAAGNSATAAAASESAAAASKTAADNSATAAAASESAAAASKTAAEAAAATAEEKATECAGLAEAVTVHEARMDIHLTAGEKAALEERGLLTAGILPDSYFADWMLNQPDTEYGVLYYDSRSNQASAVTSTDAKTRDNAGLQHKPSTDTVEGVDDYAARPEWAWRYCNFTVDENGDPYPLALEGQDGFSLHAGDVGIIMRPFCCADFPVDDTWDAEAGCYTMHELVISFALRGGEYTIFRDCRRADGSTAPYTIVPAFHLGYGADGLLCSQAGLAPAMMSHNQLVTDLAKRGGGWGKYYGRSSHWLFGTIMGLIKNGTKNFQAWCKGNTSNNVQIYAAVERDTEETWFPATVADAAKIDYGCAYSVGYPAKGGTADAPTYNVDRENGTVHAYGRQLRCVGKEDVYAADGTVEYVKILLDTGAGYTTQPVDLDVNNAGVWQARVMLSSMPSLNGETLGVLGRHDGSLVSNTNSRHSYRVQGAEYGIGAWIVIGDMVLELASTTVENEDGSTTTLYPRNVLHCPAEVTRTTNETNIRATYTLMGSTPAASGDFIVGNITMDHETGCWWPSHAVSGSYGWQDYMYNGGASASGLREFITGGHLWFGWFGGPAPVSAGTGLGNRYWNFAARG